jgi:spermidine-citrate ligase
MIEPEKNTVTKPEFDGDAFAERAGFEALANTYLREVDPGKWSRRSIRTQRSGPRTDLTENWIVDLKLSDGSMLFLEVNYRSMVGKHCIDRVFVSGEEGGEPVPVAPFRAALMLVRELYPILKGNGWTSSREMELTSRLVDSFQAMAMAVRQRSGDPWLAENGFLAAEQSLLLGHWMHPTPKSRQGIAWWQQADYCPELKGGFRLWFFAVRSDRVIQDSASEQSATEIARELFGAGAIAEGEVVIPVHPLQAHWLLAQAHVQDAIARGWMRDLGPSGQMFYPTSSVRTVFRRESEWMFKFSIPVKITNSLRRNRSHELNVGVVMARLMRKLEFFTVYPYFHVVDDPAYLGVQLPGQQETGFEVIVRTNPFRGAKGDGIVCLAALTQDPVGDAESGGRSAISRLGAIIRDLSDLEGRPLGMVARDWFEQYWQCAIEPLILLFDQHGIALEAHQQNSLFDVSNGYPTHYFFRDNQGFYLANDHRASLRKIEAGIADLEGLFFDVCSICRRFGYYLVINQLFSVIYRLGTDRLFAETDALSLSREWLIELRPQLTGPGAEFVDYLLESPVIASKANLLTRARDVDELEAAQEMAVYVDVPNPFRRIAASRGRIGKGVRS